MPSSSFHHSATGLVDDVCYLINDYDSVLSLLCHNYIVWFIDIVMLHLFPGNNLFKDERIRDAMSKVDRADFTSTTPYGDHPVSIGHGATISAPHMVVLIPFSFEGTPCTVFTKYELVIILWEWLVLVCAIHKCSIGWKLLLEWRIKRTFLACIFSGASKGSS